MCYRNKFGCSRPHSLGVRKRSQNFWDAGAPAHWDGGAANALDTRLYSTCVIVPNLVAVRQTVWAYVVEIRKVLRDA